MVRRIIDVPGADIRPTRDTIQARVLTILREGTDEELTALAPATRDLVNQARRIHNDLVNFAEKHGMQPATDQGIIPFHRLRWREPSETLPDTRSQETLPNRGIWSDLSDLLVDSHIF